VALARAARVRWWAPAIVAALTVVGAHPFCNLVFHCLPLALTAHCNAIHAAAPPAVRGARSAARVFALAAVALALGRGGIAIALAWRRTIYRSYRRWRRRE
jgi:hypothetical protein